MPTIGPDLSVIMGVAGVPGSIVLPPYTAPGVPYPFISYGRGAYLSADIIIAASAPLGASPAFWHRRTGVVIAATAETRPANTIAAGGGTWLAAGPYAGTRQAYVFGSLADQVGAGPPISVADDGTMAYGTSYPDGGGVTVITPDGQILERAGVFGVDLQALPGGKAIWRGGAIGRAPVSPFFADALGTRLAETADGAWLLYWSNSLPGLVLELVGANAGYVLETAGHAFDPDLRAVGNDLYIAWASSQAERPTELTLLVANRAGIRILADVLADRPVPTWQPLAVRAAPATFAFAHPVLVAPFKDPQGASPSPAEIVVNQTGQTANRPYIVAEDSLAGPFVGPRLGIYTESADPSGAITLAEGSQTRVFACHDGPGPFPTSTLATLRPFDVPMLELYLVAGETPDQRWDRWQSNLGSLLNDWSGDLGMTLMFYCGGGAPPNEAFAVADVLEALDAAGLLVNSSSRIKVIAPFAYLRTNGIIGHPELAAAFDALLTAAAAAGVATLTPVAPAPSPRPTPVPVPPAPIPLTPFPAARAWRGGSMRVFLKIGPYYTGVNPAAQTHEGRIGDQQFPIYWNRPGEANQGGDWEAVELEQQPDGRFRATYVESGRVLSIQPDGSLQTRVNGTYGGYEQLDATTQPDPDPVNLLYRVDNGQLVGAPLTIEAAQ